MKPTSHPSFMNRTNRPPRGNRIVLHEDPRASARCRAVFNALVEGLGGARPKARAKFPMAVPHRPAFRNAGS